LAPKLVIREGWNQENDGGADDLRLRERKFSIDRKMHALQQVGVWLVMVLLMLLLLLLLLLLTMMVMMLPEDAHEMFRGGATALCVNHLSSLHALCRL